MAFPSAPYSFAPPPAPPKSNAAAVIAIFVGVMLALAVVGVVIILFSAPAAPVQPCKPNQACAPVPSLPVVGNASPTPFRSGGPSAAPTALPATLAPGATPTPFIPAPTPVSDSPIVLSGTLWSSATLNYSFEYDPNRWTLSDSTDASAVFDSIDYDAEVVISGATAATSPADLINQQLAQVDTFMISRVQDTDDYDALLGPEIGYVNGQGDVYSGTLLDDSGTPTAPGGVTVLAATDGRLTIAVTVIVGSPDDDSDNGTQQHTVRVLADDFLKTFDWDTQQ
jgi:hypothetical protein